MDPEDWPLEKYAEAAFAWMKKGVLAGKDGEKEWAKIERSLWTGINDPERGRAQLEQARHALGALTGLGG